MVKGISSINGWVKAGVISAFLAGSAAMYASNPIKDVNNTPNQTEVVSKEGADALKSTALKSVQGVKQDAVPTVNNTRLDETFRKFAKNAEEKQIIDDIINGIYKENGTFLGGVLVQHEIDRQMLGILLDRNTDMLINNNINPELGKEVKKLGEDFYLRVKLHEKEMNDWLENSYTPAVFGLIAFDHKPNGEEVIKRLDYIAEEKANFDLDDMIEYHVYCDTFHEGVLKKRTDTQAMSDLAAFKMYMIDKLIMKNALYNHDVFYYNHKLKNGRRLSDYFEPWMNSVEPKGK